MTALKSLLFLILAAGLGAGYIPFALLPRGPQVQTGLFAYLALPLWLLGGVTILRCFWDFTFKGHGTPAPIDPPKELVTFGASWLTVRSIFRASIETNCQFASQTP